MRMLDHLHAAGFELEMDDIRLWMYQPGADEINKDAVLLKACKNVKKGLDGDLKLE